MSNNYKESLYNYHFTHNGNNYIFNTFSNGLCQIDDETNSHFINNDFESSKHLNALVSEGYVIPNKVDEINKLLVERLTYQYGRGNSMQFLIAPSLQCNLNCAYCYQRDISYEKSSFTSELANDSVEFIKKMVSTNPYVKRLKLNWFGGEPLLYFDVIQTITEQIFVFCKEKGIEYSANITTNGLLLSKQVVDYLCEFGLENCQVTIDGTEDYYMAYKNAKKGDLDNLLQNIKYASNYCNINIRFNTSRENQDSVLTIAKYISENYSMDKIQMYPAKIYGFDNTKVLTCLSDKEFDDFNNTFNNTFKEYKFNVEYSRVSARLSYCGSLRRDYAIIGPGGFLYRCEHQLGKESEIIGDVKYGFYRNEADMKFLNVPYQDKCRTCNLLPYCFGGCPSNRICNHIDFDCDAFREKFNNWILNKYFNE